MYRISVCVCMTLILPKRRIFCKEFDSPLSPPYLRRIITYLDQSAKWCIFLKKMRSSPTHAHP